MGGGGHCFYMMAKLGPLHMSPVTGMARLAG